MIEKRKLVELNAYRVKGHRKPVHQMGLRKSSYPVTAMADWKADVNKAQEDKNSLKQQYRENALQLQLNKVRQLLMIAIPWLGLNSIKLQVAAYQTAHDFLQDRDEDDGLMLMDHLYLDTAIQDSPVKKYAIPDFPVAFPTLKQNRGLMQRITHLREMFLAQSALLGMTKIYVNIRADDPPQYEGEIKVFLQTLDQLDGKHVSDKIHVRRPKIANEMTDDTISEKALDQISNRIEMLERIREIFELPKLRIRREDEERRVPLNIYPVQYKGEDGGTLIEGGTVDEYLKDLWDIEVNPNSGVSPLPEILESALYM